MENGNILATISPAATSPKPSQQHPARVEPCWMNLEQIYEYFGGNLSRQEIEDLLKDNHIKSFWKKRRLVADRRDVVQWADDMRRAKDPATTGMLGAGYVVPVSYILQRETGKRRTA